MRTITNRDMQNQDEPNLPFAQSFPIHNEAPIPINFGQSTSQVENMFIMNIS